MHKGRKWCNLQSSLKPLESSRNKVYALADPNESSKITAYFKIGYTGDEAGALMEKKVWDIAVILGMEKHFTATGITRISTKHKLEIADRVADLLKLTVGGKERKTAGSVNEPIRGSIQATIEGMSLGEYYLYPERRPVHMEISRADLIESTLALLICGMMDAHDNNIRITPSGQFQFYDNTRCFPHSNSLIWIIADDKIKAFPAIKSGFILLEATYEPFTVEERDFIKKEIIKYQGKMGALQFYLNHDFQRKELANLPAGWFRQDELLGALKERLTLLAAAIDDPKITNLRDLTLASQPNLRFFAALLIAGKAIRVKKDLTQKELHKHQRNSLLLFGYKDLDSILNATVGCGINPKMVKSLCDDPNLSFDDITKEILKMKQGCIELYGPKYNMDKKDGETIYTALKTTVRVDFKDIPLAEIVYAGLMVAQDPVSLRILNRYMPIKFDSEETIRRFIALNYPIRKPLLFVSIEDYPFKFKIAYKNLDGTTQCWDLVQESSPLDLGFGKDKVNYFQILAFCDFFKYFCDDCKKAMEALAIAQENCCLFTPGDQPGKIVLIKFKWENKLFEHSVFSLVPDRPNVLKADEGGAYYTYEELINNTGEYRLLEQVGNASHAEASVPEHGIGILNDIHSKIYSFAFPTTSYIQPEENEEES